MKKHSLARSLLSSLLIMLFLSTGLVSFAQHKENVTLKFPVWNPATLEILKELNIPAEYKKVQPNVTIEFELFKEVDYENTMKIRNAANELPDILPLQAKWLENFKDSLLPLNDLQATKANLFATDYAINGTIVGLPESMFNEFVWYRKSIFNEYNIAIPKTWGEFIEAAKKIKKGNKYIPICMGGKDAWPDYPFNEFMPALVANNGSLWNVMATQDGPFSKDQPFYKAYAQIMDLYNAKVMGPDPLGVSWDQAKMLFGSGKGAMLASGQWFIADLESMTNGDLSDIGAFFLPVRGKETEPFNVISMVENFYCIPRNSRHIEEVKDFYNWWFSKDIYVKRMTKYKMASTLKGITIDIGPIFKEAYKEPDLNFVVFMEGNEDYNKIMNAIKFDVKALGQEMMAGKNLNQMMNDLNKKWKNARSRLGIK